MKTLVYTPDNNKIMYNIDYFISKFTAISEEKWYSGGLTDFNGKFCAIGFCEDTEEEIALRKLFSFRGEKVTEINDNKNPFFNQSGPKERVLTALNYFKLNSIVKN